MNNPTLFALMYEFGTAHIPLTDVAKKYFSYDERTAVARARQGKYPFPVFRVGNQKTPWLVDAADLAKYLDSMKQKAAKQYSTAKNGE